MPPTRALSGIRAGERDKRRPLALDERLRAVKQQLERYSPGLSEALFQHVPRAHAVAQVLAQRDRIGEQVVHPPGAPVYTTQTLNCALETTRLDTVIQGPRP